MSRDKRNQDPNEITTPRVTRVTSEGCVIYDPLSIIRSGPFRKHIHDLVKNSPVQRKRAPRTTV